jgi:hypothetical protein
MQCGQQDNDAKLTRSTATFNSYIFGSRTILLNSLGREFLLDSLQTVCVAFSSYDELQGPLLRQQMNEQVDVMGSVPPSHDWHDWSSRKHEGSGCSGVVRPGTRALGQRQPAGSLILCLS